MTTLRINPSVFVLVVVFLPAYYLWLLLLSNVCGVKIFNIQSFIVKYIYECPSNKCLINKQMHTNIKEDFIRSLKKKQTSVCIAIHLPGLVVNNTILHPIIYMTETSCIWSVDFLQTAVCFTFPLLEQMPVSAALSTLLYFLFNGSCISRIRSLYVGDSR